MLGHRFKHPSRITFRRTVAALLTFWVATANLCKSSAAASYEEFPDRSVKLVVGSATGSAVDIIARLFAQHLSELWKQPVIIDNRSGANGQIAAGVVARSAPDGYTLMITTAATLTTNPVLYPDTGQFVVEDLEPVTVLVRNDFVVAARSSLNVRTFEEFLAFASANPGKLNVATSVRGGAANLTAELFKQRSQLEYTVVPFNGGGASINSLLGGHTEATFESLTLTEPLGRSGPACSSCNNRPNEEFVYAQSPLPSRRPVILASKSAAGSLW